MNRPDLIPGAHVKCVGISYAGGDRSFTQYLTKLNGRTYGLGQNDQAIIVGRDGDRLFLFTSHARWGSSFGWCNTIEAFEVIK